MKLLPFHTYSQKNILVANPSGPTHVDKGKGKKAAKGKYKADEELCGQSPTKKGTVIDILGDMDTK